MLKIYKASAGSGKTFRLAKEYIKMLLGHKDDNGRWSLRRSLRDAHRDILAITFTNKATDEMKRRILHELALLGGCEPGWEACESPYRKDLMAELHCSAAELRAAAADALSAVVMDYNFFNVSTIDSFFQMVLRAFAREAQVMGDYEVSLDDEGALAGAVSEVLTSVNHGARTDSEREVNKMLTSWLHDMMSEKMQEGKTFNVFNADSEVRTNLVKFISGISTERFMQRYDEMMAYLTREDRPLLRFRDALQQAVQATRRELREVSAAHIAAVDASGLRKAINRYWPTAAIKKYAAGDFKVDPMSTGIFLNAMNEPEKVFNKGGYDDAIAAEINRAALAIKELYYKLNALEATLSSVRSLGLLAAVYTTLARMHRESNSIQLSDTNALIHEIIGEEDAPFVYERLGMQLRHFLIDEFQDTSRMQWLNLLPLVSESHSTGSDNLIIGDEKQCIYRFRNADPSLLGSEVERQLGPVELSGTSVADNTNWRSSSDVVRFNNTLFPRILRSTPAEATYGNVCQQVSPKHAAHRGYVSVAPAGDKEFPLDRMMAHIRRQLDAGYRPCDIAVLTRKTKEARAVIDRLMREAALPDSPYDFTVISDDSLLVSSSPAVRNVITHLRFLGAPDVKVSERSLTPRKFARLFNAYEQTLARELAALPDNCSDEQRGALAGQVLADVVAALRADNDADSASQDEVAIPGSDADTILATDLTVLVERILAMLPAAMRLEQDMYITAFMDLVADYVDSGTNDVKSFLKWWDASGCRAKVSSPENERAIRVMTIHKAKGLEWPCVHVPFCDWKLSELKGEQWYEPAGLDGMEPDIVPPMLPLHGSSLSPHDPYGPQRQAYLDEAAIDAINVLYVALTRPVDELIVTLGGDNDSVGTLIRIELPHMAPDRVDDDDMTVPVVCADGESFTCGIPADASSRRGDNNGKAEAPKAPKALDVCEMTAMSPYEVLDRTDLWRDTTVELPDGYDARSRGKIIHAALTGARSAAGARRALLRMVSRGVITHAMCRDLTTVLSREMQREDVRPWFEGCRRVLSERSIFEGFDRRDGSELVKRPDRVVWTADGTIDVIDYKTGTLPDDPAERRATLTKYRRQVRGYMDLISRLFPNDHLPIRGFIWHLDSSQIFPA
ncbi:MAG: UvrD-helicase domain-containing protein [Candidatus Amulumruptor caecigallinarius]|nr:UvrD-helicase domain-containing protein [Candidatus Amulumruptor caecigallinarius]MCM1397051.1 UvrD-helicase domain-containing protein [Candidatus Amulumruptor caecigallinarius]MCM1453999.1 UvrD-helicase domain-containing protein [bacterium]